MSSERLKLPKVRDITFNVSADNVHSSVETFLRTLGMMDDNDTPSEMTLTLVEGTEGPVYQVRCKLTKEEEVQVTWLNGSQKKDES